ncbi:transmembrane protein 229B-like [Thalassophryne amazonica]|uniref:transmembrane protein 229B-like n=1 Tax=Thalassophryne amazonica TaxID=390379 RepID=UPI001471F43B|nr:transmembrane protein 229B-like [Thalassophryne amazonica]
MEARKQNVGKTQVDNDQAAEPHGSSSSHVLSTFVRLYVYALHGCLCEVAFTAVYDWCSTGDTRLLGHSSLWALPMYATAIYLMETLRAWLLTLHHPLLLRLMVYIIFIYLWEFSWGAGLRLLGACPWDYSAYRYNVGGLVTLEYALPWAVASLIAEKHVIRNTLRLRLN